MRIMAIICISFEGIIVLRKMKCPYLMTPMLARVVAARRLVTPPRPL